MFGCSTAPYVAHVVAFAAAQSYQVRFGPIVVPWRVRVGGPSFASRSPSASRRFFGAGSDPFADCTSSLSKAIEQRDIAELRTDRALCKVGAKDDAGALDDLMTAVKKEPGYGPAHFYLANRLAQGGKFAEAVKEYEAYLKAAPKGDLVKQAEERAKVARERAKKKK